MEAGFVKDGKPESGSRKFATFLPYRSGQPPCEWNAPWQAK